MKKIIIFCCLAGLISCRKECPENSGDPFFKLLAAVKDNDRLVTGFSYDSRNRLIELKNYINDSVIYNETYQYNPESRMSRRIFPGFAELYEYSRDGTLKSTTLIYPATDKEWKTEYQYSRNKISRGTTYFNGDKRGYIDYKYDSNGNTIERSEYIIADGQEDFLDEQFRLTCDDQVNPLKNPGTYPADITLKNNPVSFYHYLSVMSSPPQEYHSTYDYDDEGYPIREYRNSRVLTYHYQYRANLDNP